ncbi:MAG: membrane dipeptidase [Bacteroidales bacterium]|nr:membrane dipeptidase [Candidatus Equimonas faecalis]
MTDAFSLSAATRACDEAFARRIASSGPEQVPVIGITANLGDKGAELATAYYDSVRRAGGTPLLLAPTDSPDEIVRQLEQIDGLLLSGGGDLNPLWLGEEPLPQLGGICPPRDGYELVLCRMAHSRNVPVMGICRGCQVMAAALGGTVAQDIAAQAPAPPDGQTRLKHSQTAPRHCPTHTLRITDASGVFAAPAPSPKASENKSADSFSYSADSSHKSADSFAPSAEGVQTWADGTAQPCVNSFHHQAVLTPGPLMHVSALAPDGVVEAIEGNVGESFLLGVQWHPECLPQSTLSRRLFSQFVAAARLYCQALELHASILTLDSHCDTPMTFPAMTSQPDSPDFRPDLRHRNPHCLVDAVKAAEGHLNEVFMVSYIPQGPRTAEGYAAARRQVETTREQLSDVLRQGLGTLQVHFAIENGYALGRDISLVRHYRDLGAAYITLCHNGHNDICDSARPRQGEPQAEWGGLSPFGREVVEEMDRCGLLIDVSHASDRTVRSVLEAARRPIAATHTCCRALCDHPRNMPDDLLRAIADKGGVVQCTMYPWFLHPQGEATIDTFMQHLLHMIDVCGTEGVGIGSDFDGDGGVPGLRDASDMMHITERLIQAGYGANDICRIWGDNFRRVLFEAATF